MANQAVTSQQQFLEQLQRQAEKQAKLHHLRFIPPQLDNLTSLVGRYPWQVMLVLSALTAIVLEVVT
jgi:uncharacterized protein YlaN (UPF0358 family)